MSLINGQYEENVLLARILALLPQDVVRRALSSPGTLMSLVDDQRSNQSDNAAVGTGAFLFWLLNSPLTKSERWIIQSLLRTGAEQAEDVRPFNKEAVAADESIFKPGWTDELEIKISKLSTTSSWMTMRTSDAYRESLQRLCAFLEEFDMFMLFDEEAIEGGTQIPSNNSNQNNFNDFING